MWERWEGNQLPAFAVGMSFVPSVLALRESSTAPPPLLSESDLIALMDANGIGTDATIAEHIQTVQDRQLRHRSMPLSFACLAFLDHKPSLMRDAVDVHVQVCKQSGGQSVHAHEPRTGAHRGVQHHRTAAGQAVPSCRNGAGLSVHLCRHKITV